MSREPRNSERRVTEGHVVDSRPILSFGEDSGFNVPEHVKEEGWSYSFIPYMSGGTELYDDYENAIERRGFEVVTASTHPTLKRRHKHSPFSRKEEESDETIKKGGQILMRRREEVAKEEANYFNEKNARQQFMVDMHKNSPHDPRLFVDDRRWSSKG